MGRLREASITSAGGPVFPRPALHSACGRVGKAGIRSHTCRLHPPSFALLGGCAVRSATATLTTLPVVFWQLGVMGMVVRFLYLFVCLL